MEKKRSKGVTRFAWVIIVASAINCLFLLQPDESIPTFSFYVALITAPLSLYFGIRLLQLKNWARIGVITISIICIVDILSVTPHMLAVLKQQVSQFGSEVGKEFEVKISQRKDIQLNLDKQTIDNIKKNLETKGQSVMDVLIYIITIGIVLIVIAFDSGIIYFFTRTKVKEQFE